MTNRATEDTLSGLHSLIAQTLTEQIRLYKDGQIKVVDKDGKEHPITSIPPQLLGQAIKFLKDNGIDAPLAQGGDIDTLAGELEGVSFDDEKVVSIK